MRKRLIILAVLVLALLALAVPSVAMADTNCVPKDDPERCVGGTGHPGEPGVPGGFGQNVTLDENGNPVAFSGGGGGAVGDGGGHCTYTYNPDGTVVPECEGVRFA